tara:strand:- start:7118 stop:7507 length:390 start_codon:yes stop_codon:yes gene_type:complete
MSAKSNYLETKILDYVLRDTADWAPTAVYLSLHTSSPGEADGNEISGNGYSRNPIAFDAAHASNGTAANSDIETFTASGGDFGTITHFGIHDASSDGNLLYYGALTASKAIADGDTLSFAAGSIVITEA